jgi:Protein of unknown function (DUF2586)
MTLPSVQIQKLSSNAGTVQPSSTVLAIIAPCATGSTDQPGSYTRPNNVQSTFLEGPLVDWSAYFMDEAELPALLIRPGTSTASSTGSVTKTGTGNFSPSAAPASGYGCSDDYNILVNFITGGALGTAGITYQVSFDGGVSFSPTTALGTALTITPTIPETGAPSGVVITVGVSTATVVAGDSLTFTTIGPRMTTSDLGTSLTSLQLTSQPWDLLLVHGETTNTFVSQIDTWLTSLEAAGSFHTAVANTRFKSSLETESESAYAAALTTLTSAMASIRVAVGADGAAMVSPISGITKATPTSLYAAMFAESNPIGVDIAQVSLGPLPNAAINNAMGSPLYHDEYQYPNLDSLRLVTLRSFPDRQGVYITNPNLISAAGSDFTYLQYARVMNAGCAMAFTTLTNLLSQGIRVDPKTGFILEIQRAKWQRTVQLAIDKVLAGQVSGSSFTIAKDDNISGNGPATLTCTLQVLGFKYVKTFKVVAEFVNQLAS